MARRESLVEKKRRADERKALCDELSSAIKVVSKRRERGGEFRYNIYIYIYSFFHCLYCADPRRSCEDKISERVRLMCEYERPHPLLSIIN